MRRLTAAERTALAVQAGLARQRKMNSVERKSFAQKGAQARAERLSPEARKEIARKAALARQRKKADGQDASRKAAGKPTADLNEHS
jgi:hypothetical protein